MIVVLGWFLVGFCSLLMIAIAVAPLFVRDDSQECICRECRKRGEQR